MRRALLAAGFALFGAINLAQAAEAGPVNENNMGWHSDVSSRGRCVCAWRPARRVAVRHVRSRYAILRRPVLRIGYDPLPYRFGYYSPPYRYLYRVAYW